MLAYLTIQDVSQILQISKSTIYNNGPAQYGGIKIGGLWRFPDDKVGEACLPKPKESPGVYTRRFGKNGSKR